MTMKIFDKKLLEFMYFLTKQQKFMNAQQISKVLTINGKKITDRTIRRWFRILKKDRNFNYFMYPKQTQMAVTPILVFAKDVYDPSIFDIIPYRNYIVSGTCLKTLKKTFLTQFYVPKDSIKKFEEFLVKAKSRGLIGDYSLSKHKPPVSLYHPFHRSLDKEGRVKNCTEPLHPDFLKLLEQTLAEKEIRLHPKILKHPLLMPILCELYGEHFSSHELWRNIKFKLGENVWNYLPHKIKDRDAVAIKYIQHLLKGIYDSSDNLVQQFRVSYTPIYLNNLGVYVSLKLKNPSRFLEFVKDVGKYSVHTVVIPSISVKGTHIIYAVTSQEMFNKLLDTVNIYSKHNSNKIFLQATDLIKNTYSKIDYTSVFDPKTCSWKYEHKKYMRELEKLAKSIKQSPSSPRNLQARGPLS